MNDHLFWVIVIGWLCVLFTRRFYYAEWLSLGFGALLGALVYLGTLEREMPNDVSLATIVILVVPITSVAVFLAWPVGVFFRRVFGRKKPTGT